MYNDAELIKESEESITEATQDSTENKKLAPRPVTLEIDEDRPRYGRMIVLLEKGRLLITIGPDCTICVM